MLQSQHLLLANAMAFWFCCIDAHLTTVCTATSPSEIGRLYFFFGTYHELRSGINGKVIIKKPNGDIFTAKWADESQCSSNAAYTTGICPGTDIVDRCSGVPHDAKVTCYKGDDPSALISVAATSSRRRARRN